MGPIEVARAYLEVTEGSSYHGGKIRKYFGENYDIQCPITIDNRSYNTFEEAYKKWLELKLQGKI